MLSRPAPAPDVVVDEIGDEICLLRVDTAEVVVLNRSASDVWLLATEGVETAELIEQLARAYGVAASELADDVRTIVADLAQRGFLVERA